VIAMKNALTAVLALSLAGCGMLEAEAETKGLCVEQRNIAAIDLPDDLPPVSGTAALPDFRLDLGAAVPDLDEEGVEVDISPDTLTLGSVNGTVNFRDIAALSLTVMPPTTRPELPPVEFVYERATPPPADIRALPARPRTSVDLADYIEGDSITVRGAFTAAPQGGFDPSLLAPWQATLEMCGETRVKVDYWDRITG
jgi:hypothetical protein